MLEQAEQLSRQGDHAASLQAYEDLVTQFPDDERTPVALLRLAEGRGSIGDWEGAVTAIDNLRQLYGRSPSAAGTWLVEAQIRSQTATTVDDLRAAHATLGRVPALFGRLEYPDPVWRQRAGTARGRLSLLLGDLDLAAAEFLAVIEDEPRGATTPVAQVALADVFARQRQWTAAAEMLQRVVDDVTVDTTDVDRVRVRATQRLSLLHRTVFRPILGRQPWTSVRRLEAPGRGFSDPVGVAVAPDGRVVVTDDGSDLALTFDARGALVATTVVDRGGLPWSGFDRQLYVLDRRVVQSPVAGGTTPTTAFIIPDGANWRELDNLGAGARGALDEWLILDTRERRVMRFSRYGRYEATLVDRTGDTEVVDVALDSRGRLHVLDGEQDRVLRFRLDGTAEGAVVEHEWRRATALAVDAVGNLFVLDRDQRTVDVFNLEGQLNFTLGPRLPDGTELRSPRDLAIDDAGRLLIADRDLDVVVILE